MNRTPPYVMTRERTWWLTAISVGLFVLLSWIFGEGLFAPPLWNGADWINSPLITYLMILAIILAGADQVSGLPADGIPLWLEANPMTPGHVNDPIAWRLLLGNIYFALVWLPMRFFLGRDWFSSGSHKLVDPAWMNGGEALKSFWQKQVVVPQSGQPLITYAWFRHFLQYMLDHGWYSWFGKLIALSETLVGLALIVGAFVGLAAFCGTFMSFNYLMAGTISTSPVLFGLGMFLVLAWKVAGFWGLDRWLLPALGTPWNRTKPHVDAVREVAAKQIAT